MNDGEFENIRENTFIYRPPNYDGPKAENAILFNGKDCHPIFHICISQEFYDQIKEKKE